MLFRSAEEVEAPLEEPREVPAAAAPARPRPAAEEERPKAKMEDVFASMMSQVSGREVRVVKRPPRAAAAGAQPMVGRNDPCPCGSGKKYKKCCGRGQF